MNRSRPVILALSLALLVGCKVAPPAAPPRPGGSPTAKPRPGVSLAPSVVASAGVGARPAPEPPRAISQLGATATLTGKVKLISDHGMGVISNNTGNVISNGGAALVANNGSGVVANNGGAFRLAQAEASETLLADARIEFLDAAGRLLTDEAGKPLGALSGPNGSYTINAVLPAEGLVVRVRLAAGGLLAGGELRALRARDAAGDLALDLDTATSLGTSYVLDRYVQGRANVLDRLPQAEATLLAGALQASLGGLAARPGYAPAEQVKVAETLRGQAPAVAASFGRIEAILLAGVANGGAGLPATRVSLIGPTSLALDADGRLLIAEGEFGRIRRLRADGTLETYVAARKGLITAAFGRIAEIRMGPEGWLWIAHQDPHQLKRMAPDGRIELIAGQGDMIDVPALAGNLKSLTISISALAFRPGGGLVVGELFMPRLATVDAAGMATPIAAPGSFPTDNGVAALQYATDGALWVISAPGRGRPSSTIARLAPGGAGAWQVLSDDFLGSDASSLLALPDGAVLASESLAGQVWRYAPDGTRTLFAGTGKAEHDGDGGQALAASLSAPGDMVRGADGTLYLLEHGVGVVRAIAPAGTISTIAGAVGVVRDGDALTISLAAPVGLATDSQGRIVVAEAASAAIKRLEGDKLVTIGGGVVTRGPDDLALAASRFLLPGAIAYDAEGGLWITDTDAGDVRRAGTDGIVRKLAGSDNNFPLATGVDQKGTALRLRDPVGVAIGPDGAAYVADKLGQCVYRIAKDGATRVVAGVPSLASTFIGGDSGDGGPARAALLSAPFSLAFRPGANPPELYIADTLNCRIRRVIDPAGANPQIDTVVGQPLAATVAALSNDTSAPAGPAATAVLALPIGIAFDAAGNLYIAEAGSEAVSARAGALQGLGLGDLFPVVPGRIRRVALGVAGMPVTTIAGPGGRVLSGEDDQGIGLVAGMTFDREGRLIIADTGTNQLKLIPVEALR